MQTDFWYASYIHSYLELICLLYSTSNETLSIPIPCTSLCGNLFEIVITICFNYYLVTTHGEIYLQLNTLVKLTSKKTMDTGGRRKRYAVVWVLCYGFMDDKSYVGHWDGTDQSLTRITVSCLYIVGSEMTLHEVHVLALRCWDTILEAQVCPSIPYIHGTYHSQCSWCFNSDYGFLLRI